MGIPYLLWSRYVNMAIGRYELVRTEINGPVAYVTLDRPGKLNALNALMAAELHSVLGDISNEHDVRVVILTGAGRGFCSGADVNELLDGSSPSSHIPPENSLTALSSRIRHNAQPVIAAVNGVAAGAGLSIALACDIRLASEEATFSCLFVKRSLAPDAGASYTLPRLVGLGVAMEMALTGSIYDAHWALQSGLVNRVVPANRLMDEAMNLALEIASNPPLCVRSTRELLYENEEELGRALERESEVNAALGDSEDAVEAVRSFIEKRRPVYKGR